LLCDRLLWHASVGGWRWLFAVALRSLAVACFSLAVAVFGWLAQCVFIDEAFGIKVSKMADTRVARKYE
jgi:hypothetical protein